MFYLQRIIKYINRHPEYIFAAIALCFGLFAALKMFPLSGSDEIVHFPRAYQVQKGEAWGVHLGGNDYGSYVPAQIKQFNDGFRDQVQRDDRSKEKVAQLEQQYSHERLTDRNEKEPLAFTSATVYSPLAYIPAALGIKIAKILDLPIIWYVYLARIFCLLVWVILTFYAIRLLPFGKLFLLVVALLPTSLVQATTIGMDGVVNGMSWLIIAYTLAIFMKKVKFNKLHIGILFLSTFILAMTKQGYLLVALFPLLIPAELYPVVRKKSTYFRIAWFGLLALLTLWYISKTGPIADVLHFIQRPGINVDAGSQIRNVLSRPFYAIGMIFVQPFSFVYGGVYVSLVGVLTNLSVHLHYTVILILYAMLGLSFIAVETQTKIEKKYKLRLIVSSLIVTIGTFGLINLALYVAFTKVGLNKVEGVQGRYFLPLLPLFAVFPALIQRRPHLRAIKYLTIIVCCISLLCLLSALFKLSG